VGVMNSFIPFGIRPEVRHVRNADGSEGLGYAINYVIEDLERDFTLLGETETYVDAGLTRSRAKQAEYENIIGDILPVRIQFSSFSVHIGHTICSLMGMERMMIALLDHPELFHRMVAALTADYQRHMDAIEAGGAILCNNDGSRLAMGSWGYTNDLPSANELDRAVTFADVWGYANSQETVGMSVQMFDEFFFSYAEKMLNRCGLVSYGCCEPVDGLWERCLSRLPNLRKVSASPWCNEEALAEYIRGKKIVYHRKPSANYIAVDEIFDEENFGEHIAKTCRAASGCPLEVAFREEMTLRGEPWRFTRAVEIVREQFERHWKP